MCVINSKGCTRTRCLTIWTKWTLTLIFLQLHLRSYRTVSPLPRLMMTSQMLSWWLLICFQRIRVTLSSTIIAIEFEKWRNCWRSNELTHFRALNSLLPIKSKCRWKCRCHLSLAVRLDQMLLQRRHQRILRLQRRCYLNTEFSQPFSSIHLLSAPHFPSLLILP